jgi:hypothetical protein
LYFACPTSFDNIHFDDVRFGQRRKSRRSHRQNYPTDADCECQRPVHREA